MIYFIYFICIVYFVGVFYTVELLDKNQSINQIEIKSKSSFVILLSLFWVFILPIMIIYKNKRS